MDTAPRKTTRNLLFRWGVSFSIALAALLPISLTGMGHAGPNDPISGISALLNIPGWALYRMLFSSADSFSSLAFLFVLVIQTCLVYCGWSLFSAWKRRRARPDSSGASVPVTMDFDQISARLAANADVFSALAATLPASVAAWKPSPEKWSILEVINHLADEETEDFRHRLDLTLHSPAADWPPIDPEGWVTARNYAARALSESLNRFLTERKASLDWLATLTNPDWNQTHIHPKYGPFKAGDLLASWLEHDYLHIRQILRLLRDHARQTTPEYQVRYAGDW